MAYADTWGLVPVKRFSQAKRRLSDVLSEVERARLARAMLHDVLGNLRATTSLTGIVVVSADPEVLTIARTFGAGTIFDASESGINEAVRRGLDAFLPDRRRVLVVPADIPFATPSEFDAIVELLEYNPVVLAPALSDGGTNALAMRSPDLIPPKFGEDSFGFHRAFARQRSLCCGVFRSEGIGRDIDRAADFGPHLMSSGDLGLTSSLLRDLDLADRFGINDAPAPVRLF
jgi:2-phospho-L-lactate/phosphoenolpyruvate guanylyltransferase